MPSEQPNIPFWKQASRKHTMPPMLLSILGLDNKLLGSQRCTNHAPTNNKVEIAPLNSNSSIHNNGILWCVVVIHLLPMLTRDKFGANSDLRTVWFCVVAETSANSRFGKLLYNTKCNLLRAKQLFILIISTGTFSMHCSSTSIHTPIVTPTTGCGGSNCLHEKDTNLGLQMCTLTEESEWFPAF